MFFCLCLPVWYRPHTQTRIVLLLCWQKNIPRLKLFPNRVLVELSQLAFPVKVLPKDDRTNSFQEERLDLPYRTMIWAICLFSKRTHWDKEKSVARSAEALPHHPQHLVALFYLKSETRFPKTETIRTHNSRASNPSNLSPISKEMISDSVELWETAVCFLHIQLIGTNVWLPKTHNVPPEVDFESSRSRAKSESCNSPSPALFSSNCPHDNSCLYSHVWWMYEINRFRRLSQALVHFVIDRASLFTDHKIYQVFQFVLCISISEQFESIHVTILQQISFLLLWSGGHRCMEQILCRVVESSCLPTHNIAPHISSHDLPCHKDHEEIRKFSECGSFSCSHRGNSRFKHGSVIVHNIFAYFTLSLSASPSIHVQQKMLVLPNRLLCWVVSTSDQDLVSFQPILFHPHKNKKNPFSRCTNRTFPIWNFLEAMLQWDFLKLPFTL